MTLRMLACPSFAHAAVVWVMGRQNLRIEGWKQHAHRLQQLGHVSAAEELHKTPAAASLELETKADDKFLERL